MAEEVRRWLEEAAIGQYADGLIAEGYERMTLVEEMDDQDALEISEVLKMPRGHAKKFRNQVQRLRDSTAAAALSREHRHPQDDAAAQEERREDATVALEGGRDPAGEPADTRQEQEKPVADGTSAQDDVVACTEEQCQGSADANVTEELGVDCDDLPPEEHSFNGQWVDNTDNCLVHVRGTEVHFQGVGTYLFEAVNDSFACYLLEDEVLEGQIGEGGALYWSDGAVWTRTGEGPAAAHADEAERAEEAPQASAADSGGAAAKEELAARRGAQEDLAEESAARGIAAESAAEVGRTEAAPETEGAQRAAASKGGAAGAAEAATRRQVPEAAPAPGAAPAPEAAGAAVPAAAGAACESRPEYAAGATARSPPLAGGAGAEAAAAEDTAARATDEIAATFDGRWVDEEGGVIVIKGSELDVVGLGVYALEALGPRRCGFWMDGDRFEAQMTPDGRLVWDDESIWVRSAPEALGAVSPSQPGRMTTAPSAGQCGSRGEAYGAAEARPQLPAKCEQRAVAGEPPGGAARLPPEPPQAVGALKGGCGLGPQRGAGAMMRDVPSFAPAARPGRQRPEAAPARTAVAGPRAPGSLERPSPRPAPANEAWRQQAAQRAREARATEGRGQRQHPAAGDGEAQGKAAADYKLRGFEGTSRAKLDDDKGLSPLASRRTNYSLHKVVGDSDDDEDAMFPPLEPETEPPAEQCLGGDLGASSGDEDVEEAEASPELRQLAGRLRRCRHGHGGLAAERKARLDLARVQLARGRYGRVERLTKPLLNRALLTSTPDESEATLFFIAEAVRLAAKAHVHQQQPEEALELVEEWEFDLVGKQGEETADAVMQLAFAEVYIAMDRPLVAAEHASKALGFFKGLGDGDDTRAMACSRDLETKAAALECKAQAHREMRSAYHDRKALKSLEDAMRIYKKMVLPRGNRDGDNPFVKAEARVALQIALVHFSMQENEEATYFANFALKRFQSINHVRGVAETFREVASIAMVDPRLKDGKEQAVESAKKACNFSSQEGDMMGEIAGKHVLASAYQHNGMVSLAYETLMEALVLAQALGDRSQIRGALDMITNLLMPEDALELVTEERAMSAEVADILRQKDALERAAGLQAEMGKLKDALQTAEEAVELMQDHRVPRHRASSWLLIAELRCRMTEHEEALEAAGKARALSQEAGDMRGEVEALRAASAVHMARGDSDALLRDYKEQALVWKVAGWMDKAAQVWLELSQLMQERNAAEAVRAAEEATSAYRQAGVANQEGAAGLEREAALSSLKQVELQALRHPTRAKRKLDEAREVFRRLDDAGSEARAMQIEAKFILFAHGNFEAAIRQASQAVEKCHAAGDMREALASHQVSAEVHCGAIQEDVLNGLMPCPDDLEDAVRATLELAHFCLGRQNFPRAGIAFLQLADIYIMSQNADLAVDAATEAQKVFDEINCKDGQEDAKSLIQKGKDMLASPSKTTLVSSEGGSRRRAAPEPQREARRGVFSSMSKEIDDENDKVRRLRERRVELTSAHVDASRPDQEQRRRQLEEAFTAPVAAPRRLPARVAVEASATSEAREVNAPPLLQVLQDAKPDWSATAAKNAERKLGDIEIHTAEELLEQINCLGAKGLNAKLQKLGHKPFMSDTIRDVQKHLASVV